MRQRRVIVIAVGVYAVFIGLHVLLAWDGGAVVLTVAPAIGPWLGPGRWAIYCLVAIASVAPVGWPRTGLTRSPASGSWRLTLAPLAAGTPVPPVRPQHRTH